MSAKRLNDMYLEGSKAIKCRIRFWTDAADLLLPELVQRNNLVGLVNQGYWMEAAYYFLRVRYPDHKYVLIDQHTNYGLCQAAITSPKGSQDSPHGGEHKIMAQAILLAVLSTAAQEYTETTAAQEYTEPDRIRRRSKRQIEVT